MTKVTVTRFKAKDGSLHEKEEYQLDKDIEIIQHDISKITSRMAGAASEEKTHSDEEDDYEELIGFLIVNHEEDIRKIFTLRAEILKLHEKLMKLTAGDRDPDPVD
jgi:hypothetical protein